MSKQSISTDELVRLLKSRSKEAFTVLYENYTDTLRTIIYRMVANKTTTEDLLQNVFVKIWKHIGSYNPAKGTFFTWMVSIARRVCIDYLRSSQHQQEILKIEIGYECDEIIAAIMQPNYNITLVELHNVIQKLDIKQRQVIEMVYFRGFTYEEVALILDVPAGTIKTRARAGLKKMRKLYD